MKKVLIIGGVTGGATAAGRLRRLDDGAEIIMLERGGYISFANCGLPYHLSGVVKDSQSLLITDAETFGNRYNIDVRLNNEAVGIDAGSKTVTVVDGATGREYTESYDQLLLSPGAEIIKLPFVDYDQAGVYYLRSYQDMLDIKAYLDSRKPKSAVIIGAGFVGIEVLENLRMLDMAVTIVTRFGVFSSVDTDIALLIREELVRNDVNVLDNSSIVSVEKSGDRFRLSLDNGDILDTDMVISAVGSRPDIALAQTAGLAIGKLGGIITNDRMETSEKDIYAVGDAVEIKQIASGQPMLVALAGPAQLQARVAADNIAGGNSSYKGALGSSVIKIFDINVASTGLNSAEAQKAGINFDSVVVESTSNAGYYGTPEQFSLKVLYEKRTGRIIGGQVIGGAGVDKHGDILATAVYSQLTAYDLEQLHLCYAPPFSIPRDAVNIAGGIIVAKLEEYI